MPGELSRRGQQLVRDVDRRHPRAAAGGVAGGPAGAGRDIQDRLAELRVQALRGMGQGVGDRKADIVVVAAAQSPT